MRVNYVNRARKAQGQCQHCGRDIGIGTPYRWAKGRYTSKKIRCADCPIWRPSELTSSKMASAMAAQENAHDQLDKLNVSDYEDNSDALVDDVRSILEDAASGAEEARDDYQEGFDNLPENFQYGPAGEQAQEKIDALETWIDRLTSWDTSAVLEDPSELEPDDAEEALDRYFEEVLQEARDAIDELEA